MNSAARVEPLLTALEARRRYLILLGLRWLSVGLIVPVFVLIMIDRGLTLTQVGLATAGQGFAVLLLELPTGGLADTLGRRRLLLVASVFSATSIALLVVAESLVAFVAVWAIQGVYRALESGPLASWYIDAAQADDPDIEYESTLARGGGVVGLAIAIGSLTASGLVAWKPPGGVDELITPVLLALLVIAAEFVAIAMLMHESPPIDRIRLRALGTDVPATVADALSMIRASKPLRVLITVESLWGFAMVSFELLTPAKLEVIMSGAEEAAQVVGPMQTGAWVLSALGAAAVPYLVARIGAQRSGTVLLATQGAFVVGIGLAVGPVGVVAAFVATMLTHGAANPVHQGLLHRSVTESKRRATVVSANSLAATTGGLIGSVALGTLAGVADIDTAMFVGAASLILAAPLYLLVRPNAPAERPPGSEWSESTTAE